MSIRATILGGITTLCMCASATGHADEGAASQAQVLLDAHNIARAEFGVPPLDWSPQLVDEARGWAQRLAHEEALRHASIEQRGGRGENLWMGTAGYFSAQQMMSYFIDEKRYFRAGQFPRISSTGNWADVGHYTQIVWAETREVGCATERGRRFDFLVCRYWPGGNVMGTYLGPQDQAAQR